MPHRLRIWAYRKKAETLSLPIPHTGPEGEAFFSGAVSPDGTNCALSLILRTSQFATWRLVILNLHTAKVEWDEVLPHRLAAMAFGPDSRHLAYALGDTNELVLLD